MAVSIGIIEGKIVLRDDFTSTLDLSQKKLVETAKKAKVVGQQLSDIGGQLTRTITLPIVAMAVAVVKAGSDFESSFAGVRKTVDATEEQFAELALGIRQIPKDIPIATDALNEIAEAAGQLGIQRENILSFTRVMADLGATTVLSSLEAAEQLSQFINITGLSQTEIDRLGSAIVDLGNNLATNEQRIVDFGLRIAGAGTIAGLTEPEILAIGGAMASIGIQAEAGGTAVQKVLLGMVKAVNAGGDDLRTFADTAGMTADDFAAAFRDNAAGAFIAFVEGLGNQGDDALKTLDNLSLGNERTIRAFLSLANAGGLLRKAIELSTKAFDENIALSIEAEKRYKTFESKLTIFWSRIKDVAITIGTALLPVLLDMLGAMSPVINLLENTGRKFAELPGFVKASIVVFAGLVAAIGPVLLIVGQLVIAWSNVILLAPKMSAAVTLAAGPWGIIALAIAGATLALTLWIDKQDEQLQTVINNVNSTRDYGIALNELRAEIFQARDAQRELNFSLVDAVRTALPNIEAALAKAEKELQRMLAAEKAVTDEAKEFLPDFLANRVDNLTESLKVANPVIEEQRGLVENLRVNLKTAQSQIESTNEAYIKWKSAIDLVNLAQGLTNRTTLELEAIQSKLRDGLKKGVLDNKQFKFAMDNVAVALRKAKEESMGFTVEVKSLRIELIEEIRRAKELADAHSAGGTAVRDLEIKYEALDRILGAGISTQDAVKSGLLDIAVEAGKASRGISSYGSASSIVIDLTGLSSKAFGEATIAVADNADAIDLLKRSYDATSLSNTQMNELIIELASAANVAEGDIKNRLVIALENLKDQINDTSIEFADFVSSVIAGSLSIGDAIDLIFSGEVQSSIKDFFNNAKKGFGEFSAGFRESREQGLGFVQSLKGGMDSIGVSIGGMLNAVSVGMKALSGQTEDIVNSALGAVQSFASGDIIGGVIKGVSALIGAVKKLFGGKSTTQRVGELFEKFEEGKGTLKDLTKLAGLLSKKLNEVAAGKTGSEKEAVEILTSGFDAFVDIALQFGDQGVAQIRAVVNAAKRAGVSMEVIAARAREVTLEAMDVLEERNQLLSDSAANIATGLQTLLGDTARITAREAEFAATSVLQAFVAMQQGGAGITEIVATLGDIFTTLSDRGIELGVNLGDEFNRLGEVFAILSDERLARVIEKLEATADITRAVGDINMLTETQFQSFGDTIDNAFEKLLAGGLESNEALATLRPQLQLLNDLSEQYGFTLDDNTQALLDQAIAQGVVTERGLTSNDILIKGFDNMLEALNRIIVALGGVPVAFGEIAESSEDMADRLDFDIDRIRDRFDDMGRFGRRAFDDIRRAAEDSAKEAMDAWDDVTIPDVSPGGPGPTPGGRPGVGGGFAHGSEEFRDFGRGSFVPLHGVEQVVTASEGDDIASMVAGALRGGSNNVEVVETLKVGFGAQINALDRNNREQQSTRRTLEVLLSELSTKSGRERTVPSRIEGM